MGLALRTDKVYSLAPTAAVLAYKTHRSHSRLLSRSHLVVHNDSRARSTVPVRVESPIIKPLAACPSHATPLFTNPVNPVSSPSLDQWFFGGNGREVDVQGESIEAESLPIAVRCIGGRHSPICEDHVTQCGKVPFRLHHKSRWPITPRKGRVRVSRSEADSEACDMVRDHAAFVESEKLLQFIMATNNQMVWCKQTLAALTDVCPHWTGYKEIHRTAAL